MPTPKIIVIDIIFYNSLIKDMTLVHCYNIKFPGYSFISSLVESWQIGTLRSTTRHSKQNNYSCIIEWMDRKDKVNG